MEAAITHNIYTGEKKYIFLETFFSFRCGKKGIFHVLCRLLSYKLMIFLNYNRHKVDVIEDKCIYLLFAPIKTKLQFRVDAHTEQPLSIWMASHQTRQTCEGCLTMYTNRSDQRMILQTAHKHQQRSLQTIIPILCDPSFHYVDINSVF